MAVHDFVGNAFRGATWVSLHNGGGVGWGQAINAGFGLLIDGSPEADRRIGAMIAWDVSNGLARRAWARHRGARFATERAMREDPRLRVTVPHDADPELLARAIPPDGDPPSRREPAG
jgi:urocanate hydratase